MLIAAAAWALHAQLVTAPPPPRRAVYHTPLPPSTSDALSADERQSYWDSVSRLSSTHKSDATRSAGLRGVYVTPMPPPLPTPPPPAAVRPPQQSSLAHVKSSKGGWMMLHAQRGIKLLICKVAAQGRVTMQMPASRSARARRPLLCSSALRSAVVTIKPGAERHHGRLPLLTVSGGCYAAQLGLELTALHLCCTIAGLGFTSRLCACVVRWPLFGFIIYLL